MTESTHDDCPECGSNEAFYHCQGSECRLDVHSVTCIKCKTPYRTRKGMGERGR
jgi:hypothetical protein